MKKVHFYLMLVTLALTYSCSENNSDESLETSLTGFLRVPSLSLNIDQNSFSRQSQKQNSKRTTGNDINQFVVEIVNHPEGTIHSSWENYSEVVAQDKVELPAGNYTLRVYNDDFPSNSPSFEFPYYYGESSVFAIEYEETTNLGEIVATPKNTKVSVTYSQQMMDQFDSYQMEVTTLENSQSLLFNASETREGFFSSGYDLTFEGTFTFTKTDGSTDTRTINHTEININEATHYVVNVDFILENGDMVFILLLDDSYTEEIINLGNGNQTGTFEPKQVPKITSSLNDFIDNSISTYNLTWDVVPNATHYNVYVGDNRFNLSLYQENIMDQGIEINLVEGRNFFRVDAHFNDNEITSYLGSSFRKLTNPGGTTYADVVTIVTPLNGITYNYQNAVLEGQDIDFQAESNGHNSIRLHIDGHVNGILVANTNDNVNEQIDIQDGGLIYYHYTGWYGSNQRRTGYQYFAAITNPEGQFNLSYDTSIAPRIRIRLSDYQWGAGMPYFLIEKRETGTSGAWEIINDGWSTEDEVYDYDIEDGKTYEYRFRVNSKPDHINDSQYSVIKSIAVQ